MMLAYIACFLFKQKTAYEMRISDWSSDVCSSDLLRSDSSFREDRPEIVSLGGDFERWSPGCARSRPSPRTATATGSSLISLLGEVPRATRSEPTVRDRQSVV